MTVEMNEQLRQAARALENGAYEKAAAGFLRVMKEQPEHAALCASQIGAANFFLGRYAQAIEWYRKAEELGFDPAMVADDIREAEQAADRDREPPRDHAEVVRAALASRRSTKILTPPLPDKKQRNVRAELPPELRDVEILGLVDLTLLGSAKTALVFTSSHLLSVDADKSWRFAWQELVGLDGFTNFSQDTIGVRLASGTRKLYAGVAAAAVLAVLEQIHRAGSAVTAGGSTILRHAAAAAPAGGVAHADDERLVAHLERWLGTTGMVWHEIVSDRIHLDVHMFPPTPERSFQVLVTSGVSALPMTMPRELADDDEIPARIELCILLPADWPLDREAFADERNFWPVRLLKTIGRIPHDYATWLGVGHSVPNGDPAVPYAKGVPYTGAVLIPPIVLPEELALLEGADPIAILQVLPVTTREMQIKLDAGADGMLDRLGAETPERFRALSRSPRVLR